MADFCVSPSRCGYYHKLVVASRNHLIFELLNPDESSNPALHYNMIPDEVLAKIKSGATIKVFERVKDGDKERIAQFSGLGLARKHGSEPGASFTVRTTLAGVGVEKLYPVHSPLIEKVQILNSPRKVSRSKLYYIRDLSRKETRRKVG